MMKRYTKRNSLLFEVENDLDINDEEYVAVKDQAVYLEKVQQRIKTVGEVLLPD